MAHTSAFMMASGALGNSRVSCLDPIESFLTLIPTLHSTARITPSPLALMGEVILGLLGRVDGLQEWMPGNVLAASDCLGSLICRLPVKQLLVSHWQESGVPDSTIVESS